MRVEEALLGWEMRFGSSAVVGSFVASGGIPCGVAEGSEDPWLCGPGFHRVCRCRGATYLRRGTETVKQSGTPSLRLFLLPPALAHYPERLAVDDRLGTLSDGRALKAAQPAERAPVREPF